MTETNKLIETNADIKCECENAKCKFTKKSCPLMKNEDDRYYWKKNDPPQPPDDLVEKFIKDIYESIENIGNAFDVDLVNVVRILVQIDFKEEVRKFLQGQGKARELTLDEIDIPMKRFVKTYNIKIIWDWLIALGFKVEGVKPKGFEVEEK